MEQIGELLQHSKYTVYGLFAVWKGEITENIYFSFAWMLADYRATYDLRVPCVGVHFPVPSFTYLISYCLFI